MEMAKVSRESAPRRDDHGAVEDLAGELEGYTVNFVTLRQDVDGRALLKGLPNDECQCPHWGYVTKGRMTFTSTTARRSTRPERPSTRRPGTAR
jgi:hypothetical protein